MHQHLRPQKKKRRAQLRDMVHFRLAQPPIPRLVVIHLEGGATSTGRTPKCYCTSVLHHQHRVESADERERGFVLTDVVPFIFRSWQITTLVVYTPFREEVEVVAQAQKLFVTVSMKSPFIRNP